MTAKKGADEFTVGHGMVVGFHYDLYDGEANRIESSKSGDPVLILFGDRNTLLALQNAMADKRAGDDFSVTIPHDQAYGRYYPDRIQRLPRKQVDGGKQQSFQVGQIITLRSEGGNSPGTIVKVGKFMLDVDINHPLAGKDLTFDVQLTEVRPATDDERAHGHAHGPGGHQH